MREQNWRICLVIERNAEKGEHWEMTTTRTTRLGFSSRLCIKTQGKIEEKSKEGRGIKDGTLVNNSFRFSFHSFSPPSLSLSFFFFLPSPLWCWHESCYSIDSIDSTFPSYCEVYTYIRLAHTNHMNEFSSLPFHFSFFFIPSHTILSPCPLNFFHWWMFHKKCTK